MAHSDDSAATATTMLQQGLLAHPQYHTHSDEGADADSGSASSRGALNRSAQCADGADADDAADDDDPDLNAPTSGGGCWGAFGRFRRSPGSVMVVVSVALFVDLLVYCIIIPVLPLFVRDRLDGNSGIIGALFACYAGGLLLATPLSAWWSDRVESRRVPMLVGLGSMAASTLLFGLARNLLELALARCAQGVSAAVTNTVGLAMLADVYPNSELPTQMGIAMAINGLGGLIGPPLGGALYDHVSFVSIFLVCGACAVADLLLRLILIDDAWMMRQRDRLRAQAAKEAAAAKQVDAPVAAVDAAVDAAAAPSDSASSTLRSPVSDSLTQIRVESSANDPTALPAAAASDAAPAPAQAITLWQLLRVPAIFVSLISVVTLSTVFTGLEPLLSLHYSDHFHSSSAAIGYSYFAIAVPYMLASTLVAPLQQAGTNPKLLVAAGMAILTASLACFALPRSLYVSLVPMCAFGVGIGAAITPPLGEIGSWLTASGNQGAFARGFALFNLAYALGMFAGPLISGWLYERTTFTATMLTMAGLTLATGVLLLVVGLRERRDGAAAAAAAAGNRTAKPLDDSSLLLPSSPMLLPSLMSDDAHGDAAAADE